MMSKKTIDRLRRFGFSFEKGGAHISRTIMLDELDTLLSYVNFAPVAITDFQKAIEEDNCLSKRSLQTRKLTRRHLVELYSLNPSTTVFRALLKPIEKQPIGWEPDLNDGVRLNIRPFISVPDVGKKGAGVLRDKPNIDWGKDRGKDMESAPWYNMDKGDRINDHHLTLEEKRTAREVKAKGGQYG
jgi:hypothetical protein